MLACTLPFTPDVGESFFKDLPAGPAVFVLRGNGEPYVGKTANLRRRLQRLLGPPAEGSKRLNLRARVHEIAFTTTGSDFESGFLLYQLLRETFPKNYVSRLRLRPAPLLKLHLENAYPRASVTTRLAKLSFDTRDALQANMGEHDAHVVGVSKGNLYYGPFPSRSAAEQFASDALDFFKMRRCVDDLHPDPSFHGCVYSEMKMCLAPCFKGCSDLEYQAEVNRVQTFFDTRGESLLSELTDHRERASANLAFEEAAAAHTKIEKLKPLISALPDIVRRVDRLRALIVQRRAESGTVAFFLFANGRIHSASAFAIEQTGEPHSLEARLHTALHSIPVEPTIPSRQSMEHLAILKRWYYRSHRAGEIFFADDNGTWPMRRIVRGIGRVYRGNEQGEATPMEAPPSVS